MISAMSSIRPSLQIPFVYLTTVCLLATAAPASAHSTTSLSADDSAALTRSAAASASVAPTTYREFVSDSPTTTSTAQDTERTEVRASNSGNSITHFSNNESFSVSLPGSSSTVTRSSDSTVATLGDGARSDNFTLAITSPAEGEAAVHSILLTESAPQTFSYTFHALTRISSDGHGGADLFYADSNDELVQVGHVERAWARDAIGRPVPTHYEIHGNKLTQVVDHRSQRSQVAWLESWMGRWQELVRRQGNGPKGTQSGEVPREEGRTGGHCALCCGSWLGLVPLRRTRLGPRW